MKKTITIFLVIFVIFCFAGCSKEPSGTNSNTTSDNFQIQATTSNNQEIQNTTESGEIQVSPDNWGVSESWSAKTETTSKNYKINFPNYSGYTEGSGMIAEQLDGTIALISGQNHRCPEIDLLSEVFPAYFEQLEFTLRAFYGLLSDNFDFSIESDSPVTIGEIDMHSFTGTIKFDYDGEPRNYQFVSYATQLKTNGAYAYWVVYDVSEDQSNGKLIAEHALNMAKTFREEQ